jgi:hypothetical protein
MIEAKIADNEQTPILKSKRRFSRVEKMEIVRASEVPCSGNPPITNRS